MDLNAFEKRRVSIIMIFLATVIWGFTFIAQSEGAKHLPPFFFNGVRFWIGALVILPISIFRATKNTGKLAFWYHVDNKKETIKGSMIDSLTIFLGVGLQQIGMAYTSPGKAGFLSSLTIVFVAIIGIFFGKKVRLVQWTGIATAIFGVSLISLNENLSINIGDLFIIGSALALAFNTIISGVYNKKVESLKYTMFRFVFAAIICNIVSLVFESVELETIKIALPALLFAGVFSSGIAFTLQSFGQTHLDDLTTQLILGLESVIAALATWIFLGIGLSPRELVGCVIVFTSVLFIQLYEAKMEKKRQLQESLIEEKSL